jgi:hypothetical protein
MSEQGCPLAGVIGELLNSAQFLPRLKDVRRPLDSSRYCESIGGKIGTMPNPITSRQYNPWMRRFPFLALVQVFRPLLVSDRVRDNAAATDMN